MSARACPECARSNGPNYTGHCEHGDQHDRANDPLESLTLFGSRFVSCATGGGCVALICSAPDGSHVLITAYDEAELPSAQDWAIGCYDAQGRAVGLLQCSDGSKHVSPA